MENFGLRLHSLQYTARGGGGGGGAEDIFFKGQKKYDPPPHIIRNILTALPPDPPRYFLGSISAARLVLSEKRLFGGEA